MKEKTWTLAEAVKRATTEFKSPRVLVMIREMMEAEGCSEKDIQKELDKVDLLPTVKVDI